jgi:hypothetical protein
MRSFLKVSAAVMTAAGAFCVTLPSVTAVAQPARQPSACFYLRQVDNSRLIDTKTLLIRAGNRYFRMHFAGECNDMGTEPLILHPFDNGNQVCHAIDLDVRVRGTGQICNPTSLTQLSPAELAAIPANQRP